MKTKLSILVLFIFVTACTYGPKFTLDETDLRDRSWDNELSEPASLPMLSRSIFHETETIFYSDIEKGIDIIGGNSGLPDDVKKVYLTLFTDYSGNIQVQRKFDEKLSLYLENHGLEIMSRIQYAEVIISGSINAFAILPALVITNMEGLLFKMEVEYKMIKSDNEVIQEAKTIKEQLLVADTNTYSTNKVMNYLIDKIANYTAESILYGWQVSYRNKDESIEILGKSEQDDE